jgi:hypothetical protein
VGETGQGLFDRAQVDLQPVHVPPVGQRRQLAQTDLPTGDGERGRTVGPSLVYLIDFHFVLEFLEQRDFNEIGRVARGTEEGAFDLVDQLSRGHRAHRIDTPETRTNT